MESKRVLIVDDALELGRLLKATLASLDNTIDIKVVPSAEEAVLETQKNRVDMLVTDFRLPGISGAELVKRVRQTQPEVKVILITGVSETQMPEEGKNLMVDFFLKKPMEISDFLDASRKCMGIGQARVEERPSEETRFTRKDIQQKLEELRTNLNGFAVCLIDDQGSVRVKTGEYPEKNFEIRWLPPLLNTLTANSRVLHQFNPPIADGLQAFIGPNFSMILVSVNAMALLTLLKPEPGHNHLVMALGVILDAQRQLMKALRTSELVVAVPPEKKAGKVEEASAGDQEFKEKLQKAGKGVKKDAAVDFWETAIEKEGGNSGNLEGITFQDALKMGLVKPDGDKKLP